MTYQKQSGSKTDVTDEPEELEGHVPSPALVVGSICNTLFFDNKPTQVACIGVDDSEGHHVSQSGVLVKVQRWRASGMYGKIVQLDIAWLRTTGDYWNTSDCPYDDDIPF